MATSPDSSILKVTRTDLLPLLIYESSQLAGPSNPRRSPDRASSSSSSQNLVKRSHKRQRRDSDRQHADFASASQPVVASAKQHPLSATPLAPAPRSHKKKDRGGVKKAVAPSQQCAFCGYLKNRSGQVEVLISCHICGSSGE